MGQAGGVAYVEKGLLESAGIVGGADCDVNIKRFGGLGLFTGHRMLGNMFRGAITSGGEQVIRESEAAEVERQKAGGPVKRVGRYLAAEAGPILVQAIVGVIIGAIGGIFTGTLSSSVPTGLAATAVAGRVSDFRR